MLNWSKIGSISDVKTLKTAYKPEKYEEYRRLAEETHATIVEVINGAAPPEIGAISYVENITVDPNFETENLPFATVLLQGLQVYFYTKLPSTTGLGSYNFINGSIKLRIIDLEYFTKKDLEQYPQKSLLLAFSNYKSAFIHEFIHRLNSLNDKAMKNMSLDSLNDLDHNNVHDYFNSGLELNAFFEQTLSELLEYNNFKENYVDNFDKFNKDFSTNFNFLLDEMGTGVTDKNYYKIKKRIYQTWEHLNNKNKID